MQIVTLANREIIVRAQRYPYDCGNISLKVAKTECLQKDLELELVKI